MRRCSLASSFIAPAVIGAGHDMAHFFSTQFGCAATLHRCGAQPVKAVPFTALLIQIRKCAFSSFSAARLTCFESHMPRSANCNECHKEGNCILPQQLSSTVSIGAMSIRFLLSA